MNVRLAETHLRSENVAKPPTTGSSSLVPASWLEHFSRPAAQRGLMEQKDANREEEPVLLVSIELARRSMSDDVLQRLRDYLDVHPRGRDVVGRSFRPSPPCGQAPIKDAESALGFELPKLGLYRVLRARLFAASEPRLFCRYRRQRTRRADGFHDPSPQDVTCTMAR